MWDAGEDTVFLASLRRALEAMGIVADRGDHIVGHPVFGSDHHAFTGWCRGTGW